LHEHARWVRWGGLPAAAAGAGSCAGNDPPPLSPRAEAATYEYPAANSSYNYTYILRTEAKTFNDAEAWCNDRGGHVVVYKDQGEQEDVERHFIEANELLVPYRFTYWIGARAAASGANAWPNFRCGRGLVLATRSVLLQHPR
jgi:hypothetical protein